MAKRVLRSIRNLFRAFGPHFSVGWVYSTCPLSYLSWLLWCSAEFFGFFVSFLFFPPFSNWIHAGGQRLGQRQEWARRVVDLSEWLAPSEEWPQISGTVAKTLGIDPTPPPKSDLLVPAVFLDFFSRTLDFAGFPYRSRRPLAAASDTDRKPKASERIREQVSDGVRDPKWVREDLADTFGFILAQLFHRISLAGPAVAKKFFEMRSIASGRRTQTNQWHMDSQRAECRQFREAARRNIDRARRRLAWAHAKTTAAGGAQIRDERAL